MEQTSCCYCNSYEEELRPYGPNGAMICFDCATATPDRTMETGKQFDLQIEAASKISDIIILGEPTGPRPLIKGDS